VDGTGGRVTRVTRVCSLRRLTLVLNHRVVLAVTPEDGDVFGSRLDELRGHVSGVHPVSGKVVHIVRVVRLGEPR
jgi:hypothetical protein